MRFLGLKRLVFFILLIGVCQQKTLAQDSIPPLDLTKKEGTINIQQDPRIDHLIAVKKGIEDTKKYRIQVYNGNLEGAKKVKSNCDTQFYGWPCDISFETPNFKVRVGKFRTRLEADKYLLEVKKKYPSAFILAP